MNENIHPLIVNLTYLLCSSIEINSVTSWQVEMGKFLPSCSVRAGPSESCFSTSLSSVKWTTQIRWIALKEINLFFLCETHVFTFYSWKKKTSWIKAKIKITEHKLWFIQSSIRESVLQSEVKIEKLEANLFPSFKDKTVNQYLFTYNLVLLYFV